LYRKKETIPISLGYEFQRIPKYHDRDYNTS
jgi:hypothetical protein